MLVRGDAQPPTFTMSAVARPSARASVEAGGLELSADEEGPHCGSAGNGWRLSVVQQRGLLVPQIAVDAAAATVTVRADLAVSDAEDVERAFYNRNLQLTSGWMLSAVGTLAPSGPVAATGAQDRVTVRVTASEFMRTADLAATAEVGATPVVLSGRADGDGLLRQLDYTTYEAEFLTSSAGLLRVRWLAAAAADLTGNTAAGNLSAALVPRVAEPCDAVAN